MPCIPPIKTRISEIVSSKVPKKPNSSFFSSISSRTLEGKYRMITTSTINPVIIDSPKTMNIARTHKSETKKLAKLDKTLESCDHAEIKPVSKVRIVIYIIKGLFELLIVSLSFFFQSSHTDDSLDLFDPTLEVQLRKPKRLNRTHRILSERLRYSFLRHFCARPGRNVSSRCTHLKLFRCLAYAIPMLRSSSENRACVLIWDDIYMFRGS